MKRKKDRRSASGRRFRLFQGLDIRCYPGTGQMRRPVLSRVVFVLPASEAGRAPKEADISPQGSVEDGPGHLPGPSS